MTAADITARRGVPTIQGAYGVRISADSDVAKRWPIGMRVKAPINDGTWLTVIGYASGFAGVSSLWLAPAMVPSNRGTMMRFSLREMEAANADWRKPPAPVSDIGSGDTDPAARRGLADDMPSDIAEESTDEVDTEALAKVMEGLEEIQGVPV